MPSISWHAYYLLLLFFDPDPFGSLCLMLMSQRYLLLTLVRKSSTPFNFNFNFNEPTFQLENHVPTFQLFASILLSNRSR